jgi:hypothetical protein
MATSQPSTHDKTDHRWRRRTSRAEHVAARRRGEATTLFLDIAKWPDRCIACQRNVPKGEIIVWRMHYDVRWCQECAKTLPADQEIHATHAYLSKFGPNVSLAKLLPARRADEVALLNWRHELDADPRRLLHRRVRIRRGAMILVDASPTAQHGARLQRAQTILVADIISEDLSRGAIICWNGAGGYSRGVEVSDVEGLLPA